MSPKIEYGSDLAVEILKSLGIKFVALNPGASFRGLQDSLVNYVSDGPEIITCCHEEIAVAIAHGYAKATGKPMAVMLHNIVGLQHATMAIFNAWCDRVPIIILGGGGPMDTSKRRPGIDWVHTALVQGNLVRDFVKWDDQPYSIVNIPDSILRAYRVATKEPQGPVYVCLDTDLQESKITKPIALPEVAQYVNSPHLFPDPVALNQAASWLVAAESPVILADRLGCLPEAVNQLVELSDLLAIPVVDLGARFNFPNTHPLDLTGLQQSILPQADLVLALDVEDLYGALHYLDHHTKEEVSLLGSRARIIDVGLRDLAIKSWSADYQRLHRADLSIPALGGITISPLIEQCRNLIKSADHTRLKQRRANLKKQHLAVRKKWLVEARQSGSAKTISPAWLAYQVWESIKEEDWVLANGRLQDWPRRLWDWQHPYQYLGHSGGAGLGYCMGASLGIALANKGSGRLCLNIQPDGDFLFTPQALWTAASYRIPLLTIMHNNRCYNNTVSHAQAVAKARHRNEANKWIGTSLKEPAVDFASLARSFGVYAEGPIESPAEIGPALRRAIAVVLKKQLPALVDVVTAE